MSFYDFLKSTRKYLTLAIKYGDGYINKFLLTLTVIPSLLFLSPNSPNYFSEKVCNYVESLIINYLDRIIVTVSINGKKYRYSISDIQSLTVFDPEYEKEVTQKLIALSGSDSVFIDVGAHVGRYTILLADLCKIVISIEADPVNFKKLNKNIEINGVDNVTLIHKAMSNRQGAIKFYLGKTKGVGSIKKKNGKCYIQIESDTLDSTIETLNIAPSVIKIDVEGAELDVLRGFTKTLRLSRPIVICEVFKENWEAVKYFLNTLNYRYSYLDSIKMDTFNVLLLPNNPDEVYEEVINNV